jgi:hypothetical protein
VSLHFLALLSEHAVTAMTPPTPNLACPQRGSCLAVGHIKGCVSWYGDLRIPDTVFFVIIASYGLHTQHSEAPDLKNNRDFNNLDE